MYLVNQRIILFVKVAILFGVPLLSSFVLSWLVMWQLSAVILVFMGYILNNLYPDRILLEENTVKIKIFLCNEWFCYGANQVRYRKMSHCILLYIDGKLKYRLSMDRLSIRLYTQIITLLQPYEE